MKKNYFLLLFTIVSTFSFGQVISEFDADQAGTDAAEFIEISWTPNTSLVGHVIVLYNGSDDKSYDAIDLTGSTDANGFFVLNFPSNGIQNGPDAIALYLGAASSFPNDSALTTVNLLDAVVYGTNDSDDTALLTGLGEVTQYNDAQSTSLNQAADGTFYSATPSAGAENTLSIHEAITSEFSVYPNPVTNGTVNIKTNNNEAIQVSIFDVLGKQVLAQNLTNTTLNVSSLNAGVYVLRVSQNGNSTTKKLVIK